MTNANGADLDLWVQPPPGWLELTAFPSLDVAVDWLDRWLDTMGDKLDETDREPLRATLRQAYRATADGPLMSSGVVITALSDEQATIWQYGLAAITATLSEVDPIAIAERLVGAGFAGAVDETEEFMSSGGHGGLAIYTRLALAEAAALTEVVPHADPTELGVCVALVPIDGAPDRLAIVLGISPTIAERRAMAVGVAMMAGTVQAVPPGSAGPVAPGRVIVNANDSSHTAARAHADGTT